MDIHELNPFKTKTINNIHFHQFLTTGAVGSLECLLSVPETIRHDIITVICHPHPVYGGSMNNKVVTTIAKILNKHDIPVMRFNFRGVERSDGVFDEGTGEKEDLRSVSDLMHKLYPNSELWLAGFSFGSYIAASMQQTLNATQLITIAPAVTSFDFKNIKPNCPWLLIQGLADEIIDADEVLTWANNLEKVPTIETMEDTSHFFHHRLIDLGKAIESHLFPQSQTSTESHSIKLNDE